MIKLICDLNITLKGHNAGHIQYIVNNIKVKKQEQVYFLFNKSARDIIDISNTDVDAGNFCFSESDFEENSIFDKLKFKDWKVIDQHAKQLRIDELFIMELTRYEVQIGRSKVPFKISGIEFRPSHRIKASNERIFTWLKAKSKKYKKRFFEAIMLRCKSLNNIYIFNDLPGATSLNDIYHTNVFKYLPDPIYDYAPLDAASIVKMPVISRDRVVFIIFGAISSRKNIKNILDGFSLTENDIHNCITLLIIGKAEKLFEEKFKILIETFTSNNPGIELRVVNDFVSDSQMEYYFGISHVSLLVYANFYGSSGLLGRAAKYNSISLVPNVGLMAEICKEYNLGYLCDPDSPADIKEKITLSYDDIKKNKRIDGKKFYQSHSPESFLQTLNI